VGSPYVNSFSSTTKSSGQVSGSGALSVVVATNPGQLVSIGTLKARARPADIKLKNGERGWRFDQTDLDWPAAITRIRQILDAVEAGETPSQPCRAPEKAAMPAKRTNPNHPFAVRWSARGRTP
jgi:hypothetical protein